MLVFDSRIKTNFYNSQFHGKFTDSKYKFCNNSVERNPEIPKPITNKEAIGVDADDDYTYLYQCIKFNLMKLYKVAEYKRYVSVPVWAIISNTLK